MSDKELLSRNLQTVFLGDSKDARKQAKDFHKKYGIISYICDTKRSLPCFFSAYFAFWKIPSPAFDELLCEELLRLASFDEECIYIAVPTSDVYREFINKNSDKLRTLFVLNSPEDVFRDIPIIKPERR